MKNVIDSVKHWVHLNQQAFLFDSHYIYAVFMFLYFMLFPIQEIYLFRIHALQKHDQ